MQIGNTVRVVTRCSSCLLVNLRSISGWLMVEMVVAHCLSGHMALEPAPIRAGRIGRLIIGGLARLKNAS